MILTNTDSYDIYNSIFTTFLSRLQTLSVLVFHFYLFENDEIAFASVTFKLIHGFGLLSHASSFVKPHVLLTTFND